MQLEPKIYEGAAYSNLMDETVKNVNFLQRHLISPTQVTSKTITRVLRNPHFNEYYETVDKLHLRVEQGLPVKKEIHHIKDLSARIINKTETNLPTLLAVKTYRDNIEELLKERL